MRNKYEPKRIKGELNRIDRTCWFSAQKLVF